MRNRVKTHSLKKRLLSGAIAAVTALAVLPVSLAPISTAEAETNTVVVGDEGSATLRIFSTTDLHGQSTTYNYDTASVQKDGSLAQISSVINKERKSLKNGTSILVDSGDNIHGLGADAIKNGEISGKQYMFEVMKAMGYDAITLGNHDFDYGYKYIKGALADSGMEEKVVLANVKDVKTAECPWAAAKMITKTVTTTMGVEKEIKIGVVGVTMPKLSNLYDCREELYATDIIKAVKEQASSLRFHGADVVVVLSHSGIEEGEGKPEELAENVAYHLTKLKNVDVVCAGHLHRAFPSDDPASQKYYSHSGIDKKNGTVNGKVLVQSSSHGKDFGISDITINFRDGKTKITGMKARTRRITAKDKEDKTVKNVCRKYDKQIKLKHSSIVGESGTSKDNYFGMLEDNPAIQLCNEAKIAYGKQIVAMYAPRHKNVPVIAGTAYSAGDSGSFEYLESGNNISYKDILNMQDFGRPLTKTYYITGAQLREELEWQAAGLYETPGAAAGDAWKDGTLAELSAAGLSPVTNAAWDDWSGMMVYDGIEYTIDPTQPARYSKSGEQISDGRRIVSLTYNGNPIPDDLILILVSDGITSSKNPVIGAAVKKQQFHRSVKRSAEVISEYLQTQLETGALAGVEDKNWQVVFPEGDNYVIKTSTGSTDIASQKPYITQLLYETKTKAYYRAGFTGAAEEDTYGPLVVASPASTEICADKSQVVVQASDRSGISSLFVLPGIYSWDAPEWGSAHPVENGSFTVKKNGVYSVRAADGLGNVTVRSVAVTNISHKKASTPTVEKVRNTDNKVNGTASPKAKVAVKTESGLYSTKADKAGAFSCPVEDLRAGEEILVKQTDTKGRKSEAVKVPVKRRRANKPLIHALTNLNSTISGVLNESGFCGIAAMRGKQIFIGEGQKKAFKQTELYQKHKDRQIVETPFSKDEEDGHFSLMIPGLNADQRIKVYEYDWLGQMSKAQRLKVTDVAPNQPALANVDTSDGWVQGVVPQPKRESYTIRVKVGHKTYTAKSNADGSFSVKIHRLLTDKDISVCAEEDDGAGGMIQSKTVSMRAHSDFSFRDSLREKISGLPFVT